ncbi:hypothetical protein M0R36_08970 [bacterium]|jgi:hypothetical protein|nr:hypothetical protein [bacterium]
MNCKRIGAAALVLLTALSPAFAQNNPASGDYDIHEWGVLVGCGADTNYFSTSRPMKVYAIREPVIYVHSRDKKPFALDVTFQSGHPTDTFPPAVVTNNVVSWREVMIAGKQPLASRSIPRETFIPLKDIINTLSDTDSDTISCGGLTSKFLFYEGEIPFTNRLAVKVDQTKKTVQISNRGMLDVHDVMLIQPGEQTGPMPFMRQSLVAHISRLEAGQTAESSLTPITNQVSFAAQLLALGFTEKEAISFETLWRQPMLQIGNLIYRLSDEECAHLTSLAFNPKPKQCIRALYVVVKP